MEILTDMACLEQSSFDIAYVTEIDPLWQDDTLTALINPEVALFANPLAQTACAADCGAATGKLPLAPPFWCAGCPGQMRSAELRGGQAGVSMCKSRGSPYY